MTTTSTKVSKHRVPSSRKRVDASSTQDPVHQRYSLSMAQAVAATRVTHRDYTHNTLTEGKVIPLPHNRLALLIDILGYIQDSPLPAMHNWHGIGDIRDELIELLTYDVLDCNGQPPSLGFIRLPIDEFRSTGE